MNKDQLFSLIATYRSLLRDAAVEPQIVDTTRSLSREEALGHCLWTLEERIEPLLHRIGGFQEAVRLIGCIQGTSMALGLCTIAETRQHANDARLNTIDHILDDGEHSMAPAA